MEPRAQAADILIHPQWIVPVQPHGVVLENHSIALSGDRISALVPRSEAQSIQAQTVLELPGQVVLPGLINCHGHAAMSLLRGYADDQPLMPWLEQHIWPAEQAHVSAQFVSDGTELAIAEMIRSGTTTFSDMYFFPDACAAAAQRLGMRCQITFPIFDFPTAWGKDADDYISKGLALRDDLKHKPLITVVFGPHATYTVCQNNLAKVATLAAELDTAVHIICMKRPVRSCRRWSSTRNARSIRCIALDYSAREPSAYT
ncbi:MAG: amidohydrolase family protein [Halioglobus sp.]